MAEQVIPTNLRVRGSCRATEGFVGMTRAMLDTDEAAVYPVPPNQFFVFDSGQPLPATPASDDLGIVVGTHGTGTPKISAGDLKNAGSTTRKARVVVALRPEYVAGEPVLLRFSAGMETTVASTACTLDIAAFKTDGAGGVVGADLYTGAAVSINTLGLDDRDFALTATDLDPGDEIDVLVSVLCNDTGTGTAVTASIGKVSVVADVKG